MSGATMPATKRCGYVAIVGEPNAGKSTLLNQLVGAKVAIVSPKVQTTRTRITAIAMEGDAQIVFLDTPGIFQPKRRLERAMVQAAWSGADDADRILLLADAERGLDAETRRIMASLAGSGRRASLVINKIDLVRRDRLLGLAAEFNALFPFEETFMISALTGDGVAEMRRRIAAGLPEGPWLYPPDQLADMPERMLAAEITREKLFHRLHDELPYASTVETEGWREQDDGSVRIEQVIYVAKESQKPIVLGRGGRTVKAIGQDSRRELETILGRRVHLFLFVKVRERWLDDPERYREMGLDFPKS
ncbi:MAG: GTPase Era [Alphaproteobacteria bacterium]|nr:GTPase Era [Alphaproteobacteria bacterium]